MMRASGIYQITSPSGKCYIGSAADLHHRRLHHFSNLRNGKHHSDALQNAAAKYGLDNLKYEVLLVCSKENLIFYEQLLIDGLHPEYNVNPVAGNCLGVKRPSVSEKLRGRIHTPEAIARMKNLTDEQREARSRAGKLGGRAGGLAGKGRPKSAETRRKMSESAKARNFANHFKKEN